MRSREPRTILLKKIISGWWFGTWENHRKMGISWGLTLVGGLEPWNFMTFHSVGNVIIPTDELIFFRGVGQPPTRFDEGI